MKTFCLICNKENVFNKCFDVMNPRCRTIKQKKYTYYLCSICDIWSIFPRPTQQDFEQIYKDNYYPDLESPVKNNFLERIYNMKIFSSYEDLVADHVKGKNKKILDIGCGTGAFLERMKGRGYIPFGLDPFKDAVNLTRKKIGNDNVMLGYISRLNKQKEKFDVVTMWHVLEHTLDPVEDLKTIKEALRPKGKLIFEVPNADSFVMSLFKENYSWNMIPEHHIYFGVKSTKKALSESGYKIEKMYTPPRALLNFSNSLKNYLNKNFRSKFLIKPLYILSIPVSVIAVIVASSFNQGEVLRVVAYK